MPEEEKSPSIDEIKTKISLRIKELESELANLRDAYRTLDKHDILKAEQ